MTIHHTPRRPGLTIREGKRRIAAIVHVIEPPADFQAGTVLAGDDRVHARQRFRLAGIDAFDLP